MRVTPNALEMQPLKATMRICNQTLNLSRLNVGSWRRAGSHLRNLRVSRIPWDVVDEVLFYLLHAIDEGLLRLTFTASNGVAVDLTEQGLSELAGWYMGSGGWRAMYSKERFVDDFADLRSDDS